VISQLLHGYSALGVYFQALFEDVDTCLCEGLFQGGVDFELAHLDGFDNLVIIVALEGEIPMEHGVEDNPSGPDIDAAIDFVVLIVDQALRRHIGQASSVKVLMLHEGNGPSDAEVNYLYLPFL
jgi:hypothetical protein